jgi:acetylornithine deacetylase
MKGSMAAAFWALRILKDLGFEPAGDILFESVVDEEFAGGNGTLAARLRGHNADLAVIGEPTRLEVCPACLGAFLGDLTLTGKAGMPFMGAAIPNPIQGAARAVELFSKWQERWRSDNNHPLFSDPGKELNVLLWRVDSTRPGEFTQMGTPLLARLAWIVWCHPGMTEKDFYARFRAFWKEQAAADPALAPFALEVTPAYHFVRPWETPANDPAVQAVVRAFQQYAGQPPGVGGASFSCDLAVYGDIGKMPSVLLGPRGDNLHAPDEWCPVEDILTLTGIYANLARLWCGRA